MAHITRFNGWSVHGVWGRANRARPVSKIRALVVHHSVTMPTGYGIEEARKVEQVIRNRGKFGMVAYNYIVASTGQVYEGRGLNYGNGANSGKRKYRNSNTISVCFVGMFHKPPTEFENLNKQLVACRELISTLNNSAFAANPIRVVVGHKDVSATACPGDRLYAAIPSILGPDLPKPVQAAVAATDKDRRTNARIVGVKVAAVKQVQRALNVTADGVIGPKTWAAIAAKTGKR